MYKIGKANAVDAVIEPRVGGRSYERGDDGSTCDWGRVLAWEPHSRLVLSWDITADWQYDPTLQTEIEVRFIADGDAQTRVEFEHRRLDRYGDRRDEMRTIFDKTGDWGRLLAAFAQTAATSDEAIGMGKSERFGLPDSVAHVAQRQVASASRRTVIVHPLKAATVESRVISARVLRRSRP
jgi:uncharacterized protein YndB with AHSA1/START domain